MGGPSISPKRRTVSDATLGAVVAVAVFASISVPALAQEQSRQSYSLTFTTEVPNSSSGSRLAIDYRDPENPKGKPPAVETIIQRFHRGTVIDTSVPPRCQASDPQLIAQGPSACPPETRVGGGRLLADTGAAAGPLPRVLRNRVTFFNADQELILVTESTNTEGPPIRTSSRVQIDGRTMTSTIPPFPGVDPEDPFLAIKRVRTRLDAVSSRRGAEGRSFIETPGRCPSDGTWTSKAIFTYRDGVTQVERNPSPCVTAAESDEPPDEKPADGGRRPNGEAPGSPEFPRGGVEAGRVTPSEHGSERPRLLGAGVALVALAGVGMLALRRRA